MSDQQIKLIPPYKSGLDRRTFIKKSAVTMLLAGLFIVKPGITKNLLEKDSGHSSSQFSKQQSTTLNAIHLQLFPADGNGPSAADINALPYLEWALTDPENIADGDREFIIKGIGWLEDFSQKENNMSFVKLGNQQQQKLIQKFSTTKAHENWMSLLVYYLLEALLLDPVYGGNPQGIGWKWLEHQPGYPRPSADKTYRQFVNNRSSTANRKST